MRDATGERKTLPSGGLRPKMLLSVFVCVFAACFDLSQGVSHLDAVYIEGMMFKLFISFLTSSTVDVFKICCQTCVPSDDVL